MWNAVCEDTLNFINTACIFPLGGCLKLLERGTRWCVHLDAETEVLRDPATVRQKIGVRSNTIGFLSRWPAVVQ